MNDTTYVLQPPVEPLPSSTEQLMRSRPMQRLSQVAFTVLLALCAVEPIVIQILVPFPKGSPQRVDVSAVVADFVSVNRAIAVGAVLLALLSARRRLGDRGRRLIASTLLLALGAVINTKTGARHADATATGDTLLFLAGLLLLDRPRSSVVVLQIRIWLGVYVYGSLALAVLAPQWAVRRGLDAKGLPSGPDRLFGLTDHPTHLAPLAAVFAVLALARAEGSRWRYVHGVAGAAVIVLSGTLTSLVAVFIGLLYFALATGQWGRVRHNSRRAIGVAIGVVAGVAGLVATRPEFTDKWHILYTADGRTVIWRATAHVWRDHPLLGYGPYVFDARARLEYMGHDAVNLPSAHNQFLQSFAQGGLLLGAILLVFVWALVSTARRHRGVPGAPAAVAVTIVLLVTMLTEVALRYGIPSSCFFLQVAVVLLVLGDAVSPVIPRHRPAADDGQRPEQRTAEQVGQTYSRSVR